jgi:hypothetical protein
MTTNNISTVRQLLIDQMQALRSALPGSDLEDEIHRAKGMAEVAQSITNASRVELDYLRTVGNGRSDFIESKAVEIETTPDALPNGITSITRHRIAG